jgi:hypothetical protein
MAQVTIIHVDIGGRRWDKQGYGKLFLRKEKEPSADRLFVELGGTDIAQRKDGEWVQLHRDWRVIDRDGELVVQRRVVRPAPDVYYPWSTDLVGV